MRGNKTGIPGIRLLRFGIHLHTIKSDEIRKLIDSLVKYLPKNARFCTV